VKKKKVHYIHAVALKSECTTLTGLQTGNDDVECEKIEKGEGWQHRGQQWFRGKR